MQALLVSPCHQPWVAHAKFEPRKEALIRRIRFLLPINYESNGIVYKYSYYIYIRIKLPIPSLANRALFIDNPITNRYAAATVADVSNALTIRFRNQFQLFSNCRLHQINADWHVADWPLRLISKWRKLSLSQDNESSLWIVWDCLSHGPTEI